MIILIKAVAGSHLFGTNTPESDKDFKGVYLPDSDEILLGDYAQTISETTGGNTTKNSKGDTDVELYSLKKFLKMIENGDTAALELLFTPEDKIVEKHWLWDTIIDERENLLSCKVNAMIGYARQQANKYGIKGSRMGELNNCIEVLKTAHKELDFKSAKLKHSWGRLKRRFEHYEHIEFIDLPISSNMENKIVPGINILGKKFDHHCGFIYVIEILKKIYKNYGHRAREAKKNNGIDWKALSHAVRVSLQGIELLETGKITLPLKAAELTLVKQIKLGNIPYKEVAIRLEELLVELESAKTASALPDKIDKTVLDKLLLTLHKQVVLRKI